MSKKQSVSSSLFFSASILCLIRIKGIDFLAYGYVFFGILCILLMTVFKFNYKIQNTIPLYASFILFLVNIFYICSGNKTDSIFLYYSLFLWPFISYFSTVLLVQNIDTNRMLYDIEKLIKLYILFLIIDALVRYGYLYFAFRSGTATIKSFYNFKFSPITAGDTNYLALRILYPMCLLIFVEAYFHKNKWRIYIYTFYGFIILTISRSAIVAGTLLLMIRHFSSLLRYKRYCLLSMELIFGIAGLVIVFMSLFLKDGSFATKLEILKSLNKIYDAQLSNVIFGFGIDEGRHIYSYRDESFGHTHLSLIIGQFGILGLLLYIGFFIGLYIKTKGGTFYLTCAFIISGFSLIDLGPNLFWVFGLLDVLSRRRTKHEITVYS